MIATLLALVVAVIHLYIALLEMVLWDKPRGRRTFGTTQEFATATKSLALNQGLYNGFLAAGILYGLFFGVPHLTLFMIVCVLIAGIVGFLSGVKTALYAQTIPAALSLLALVLGL